MICIRGQINIKKRSIDMATHLAPKPHTSGALARRMSLTPCLSWVWRRHIRDRWISLTPCFSWVPRRHIRENRFNGLPHAVETVETVPTCLAPRNTQLKQGVNERGCKLPACACEICGLAVLLCCLASLSCVSDRPNHGPAKDDLAIYRITNDQAGHEYVKTEQLLGPVGSVIIINGLEFEAGSSTLTEMHKHIVQQIFNSIEEITENTVGDTNTARVAEYKKMEFEIRGYPDDSGSRESNMALAQERAKAVLDLLTYLGTPPWRLKATALDAKGRIASNAAAQNRKKHGRVEFIRTR